MSLAGCSLPLESENPPREVIELYRHQSFSVKVSYDQLTPALSWKEVKGWDGKPAESYDIEIYNSFSGEPIKTVAGQTATFYLVPCKRNNAYRVYANVRDGVIRSQIIALDQKECEVISENSEE